MVKQKAKRARAKSSAYKLVEYVWQNSNTTAWVGHAGDGLNQVMASALTLAIEAGMRFDIGDFRRIRADFRGGYWYGGDADEVAGERFYCRAVRCGNESACLAFEDYAGRGPFKLDTGKRVALGDDVVWGGERCEVTSFKDGAVGLCSYKVEGSGADGTYSSKVKRRHSVSHGDWVAEMKVRKQSRKPPAVNTVVTLPKDGADYVVTYSCGGRWPEVSLVSVARDTAKPLEPLKRVDRVSLDAYRKARPVLKAKSPDMRMCNTAVDRDGNAWRVSSYSDSAHCAEMELVLEHVVSAAFDYQRLTYSGFLAAGFKLVEEKRKKGGC